MISCVFSVCFLALTQGGVVWNFEPETISQYNIQDAIFAEADFGYGLVSNSKVMPIAIGSKDKLPVKEFTVGAWVSIEEPRRWGGIIGCVQDDADVEYGWVLGYNETQFTFGLSTTGADDGDGLLTYLDSANQTYEFGTWHHVVATYDGKTLRLYVDGVLSNETSAQSGDILYNDSSPFVLGAYVDGNENHPLDGRLLMVSLEQHAATAAEVAHRYEERKQLSTRHSWTDTTMDWVFEPFPNWQTTCAMSV